MRLLRKFWRIVRHYPGLCLLVLLLGFISAQTIKPGFYLMGWDNYSSYFNLPTNIFRTLFATWREYRGFGVPSDSESVDVFRQLYFAIGGLLARPELLDQLYFVLCLFIGVVCMYILIRRVLLSVNYHNISPLVRDIAGAMGAFFYLFNLNTLGVFYFPIIPYVTRFAALPGIFLIFQILLEQRHVQKKILILAILGFFFFSGSSITATVFITIVIALFMYILVSKSIRRGSVVMVFFLTANAFWLLPFINYTIQKSPIVGQAPSFVEANQIQLNQPASYYSPRKQMTFVPNFFSSQVTNTMTGIKESLHPIATVYSQNPYQMILFIFPVLYMVGFLLILVKVRVYRFLIWIPGVMGFFLFLSFKEYSPVGFLYTFIQEKIPYFQMIFRFGDTKFHPLVVFAGSIAVSVFVFELFRIVRTRLTFFALALVVVGHIIVFRSYMTGNLIGSFMFNKIPPAYFDIASSINADLQIGRVLHLPYDPEAYWKSYSWGYIGSSFLHYFINKPFFDKTFDPGSLENAAFFTSLTRILSRSQEISEGQYVKERALSFYHLLADAGISYVIMDDTVSADIKARNMLYWGRFNGAESRFMMGELATLGLAKKIKETAYGISLYAVQNPAKMITFGDKAQRSDPFLQQAKITGENQKEFMLSFTNPVSNAILYAMTTDTEGAKSHIIEVRSKRTSEGIELTLYQSQFPTINGNSYQREIKKIVIPRVFIPPVTRQKLDSFGYVSNWHVIGRVPLTDFRLSIDGVILPIPNPDTRESSIGSVLVHKDSPHIVLYLRQKAEDIDYRSVRLTEDPDCLGQKSGGYTSVLSNNNLLHLAVTNGSLCAYTRLPKQEKNVEYAEIELTISGEEKNLENRTMDKVNISLLPKPIPFQVCLQTLSSGDCFNSHSLIAVGKAQTIGVPYDLRGPDQIFDNVLFFRMKTVGKQSQAIVIDEMSFVPYRLILSETIDLLPEMISVPAVLDAGQNISVSVNKMLSRYSWYSQPGTDAFDGSYAPCEGSGYRTWRLSEHGWMSYFTNCSNSLFVQVPFTSDNYLLWIAHHQYATGKIPRFILQDRFGQYMNELFSRTPEELAGGYSMTYIQPQQGITDDLPKQFTIAQDGENEGVFALRAMSIVEIPEVWRHLRLEPESTKKIYTTPDSYTYKRFLPSLWQVDIKKYSGDGSLQLRFNQGYDKQWKLIGSRSITTPVRCGEFANCFEIPGFVGEQTMFIFYTPEILSFAGWAVTLFVLLFGWKYFAKRS